MSRTRLPLLTLLLLLAGCTEVVSDGASTRLTHTWGLCLAVAAPALGWLGLVALFMGLGRRARRRSDAQALAEDSGEALAPAPGKALLRTCGVGCALIAGLLLFGPVLPFLVYRVEVRDGGFLLIREFPATHRFARREVTDLRVLPAALGSGERVQITAGEQRFFVNASEVGQASFERISQALERWYRTTPLDAPAAGVEPAPSPPAQEEDDAEPPPPPEPAPVRAPAEGDAELTGKRLVLSSIWGVGALQHTAAVGGLAVTPSGERAVAGDADGVLRLWDLRSGASVWAIRGHAGPISSVVCAADGETFITSSVAAGTTSVWSAASGEKLHTLSRAGPVAAAPGGLVFLDGWIWDPPGDRCRRPESSEWLSEASSTLARTPGGEVGAPCAVGGGRRVEGDTVFDLASGRPVQTLAGAGDGKVLTVAPNGLWVAGGGAGSTIEIYQVAAELPGEGEEPFYEPAYQMLEGRFRGLRALAFSADGKRIAAGDGIDRVVRVFDVESGQLLHRWEGHTQPVSALVFTPDGERLISAGEEGAVRVWDLASGEAARSPGGHRGAVTDVAVAPRGDVVVSAGEDYTVRVWDLESGAQRRVLREHSYVVRALCFEPGGFTLLSGGADGRLVRWGLETGRKAASVKDDQLRALLDLERLPDGTVVVADGSPRPPRWNLDTGSRTQTLNTGFPVRRLAASPDRSLLALAGDEALQLVRFADQENGKGFVLVRQLDLAAVSLRFSADGQRLFCGTVDGVRVTDASGEILARHDLSSPPLPCWAFAADGARAFLGGRGALILLDLQTGEELERLSPVGDRPTAACFVDDGERLVIGTARGLLLRYAVR